MSSDRGTSVQLSVVMPAFNEAQRITPSLERLVTYLDTQRIDGEILVVDDGSSDDTAAVATRALRGRPGRVVRDAENRGKGHAVRRGVLEARGRWVLMTDADLSSPIEEHAKLARAAREQDLDIAIGSRGLATSVIEVRQHRLRETMGRTFNVCVRTLTGLPYRDTQCGFKLLDRRRTRPLFERMIVDRFAFDAELLFLAMRFGLRVDEVPVVWRNDDRSTVSVLRDPLNMLWDLLRVRWRFRRGLYNPTAPAADG